MQDWQAPTSTETQKENHQREDVKTSHPTPAPIEPVKVSAAGKAYLRGSIAAAAVAVVVTVSVFAS